MKARGFHSRNFPQKVFLCSWSDNKKDTAEGQTPPYTGLNDCSHFVSECLRKAGIDAWALNAPELVRNLLSRSDTKTLCFQVNKDGARNVINSGLLTAGAVIAFSDWNGFRHATLYLGGRHAHQRQPSQRRSAVHQNGLGGA